MKKIRYFLLDLISRIMIPRGSVFSMAVKDLTFFARKTEIAE